jgi:hypothetical protein
MSSFVVADACCWVLQTLNFNVVDVEFSMLQTCDVGFCVEEEGRKAPDVGCCTQHGSQHGCNIVATWGRREERLMMLDVARSRVRNMFATCTQWTLDQTADD